MEPEYTVSPTPFLVSILLSLMRIADNFTLWHIVCPLKGDWSLLTQFYWFQGNNSEINIKESE